MPAYKNWSIGFVFSLLFFQQISFGSSQPPEDSSLWVPRLHILLKQDSKGQKARKLVEEIETGRKTGLSVKGLELAELRSARLFLPKQKEEVNSDSARAKLDRFVTIEVDSSEDLRALFDRLASDPNVEYVGIDSLIQHGVSSLCNEPVSAPILSQTSFSKTWGRSAINADAAWNYEKGHAYIAVVDLGIEPDNADLIDFDSTGYQGGNFHPNLAFDAGDRVTANGQAANPFTGLAFFGEVDEYKVKVHPTDTLTCDTQVGGNSNGYFEAWVAGHGTHVAGVIGANSTNNDDAKGICNHCPMGIARAGYASSCMFGQQSHTGQHYEAVTSGITWNSVAAAAGFSIDIGVQVINTSSGGLSRSPTYCNSNGNDPYCLVIQYAEDRDVIWVAAAGNEDTNSIHFPAGDSKVFGVSGISPNGTRWSSTSTCGSNYGGTASTGPSFSAPAEGIYSTMYADMNYIPAGCHEYNDDNGTGASELGDGFGYCTGTSMASPHIAGVVGLVRSVNPLIPKSDIFQIIKETTDRGLAGSGFSSTYGWGIPRADKAVQKGLGTSGYSQVKNRAIPLFNVYATTGEDFINTTKPQIVLAFTLNTGMGADSYSGSRVVSGFQFSEASQNPSAPTPRADIFILSTHVSPDTQSSVIPVYRVRWVGSYGGNPNDTDWTLVSSVSELESFNSVGYQLDGMEGYIYAPCSPEPSCIPDGAEKIYRAYHASRDDHAIFASSDYSTFVNMGYNSYITKLGYAYLNQDLDSDGLIDGMEYILGTDPNIADSDCDGISDGVEYPMANMPVSDPMDGSCGGGAQVQTPWGSNSGTPTSTNVSWDYALGYHFTPGVDGVVNKLGGYFNGTKTVRLFNKTTGAQLAVTTVSSNNNWSYSTITPVSVAAGQTYTVAAYLSGSGASYKSLNSAHYFPNTYGDITITGSTYAVTSSNPSARPTATSSTIMYGQADIEFEPD